MKELNLVANGTAQERIKEYLEQNASDILANKINNGVKIEKDDKTLINKKTLDGFMRYASEEARKLVENNATCACIEDSVVFGWAIHYFEEDSIEGTLFNEDGTEYSKPKPAPKKSNKAVKKEKTVETVETKPTPKKEEKNGATQISLFDLMNGNEN